MNPALPPALKARTDALLEGVSRKGLATRAAAISQVYRVGGGSAAIVTDEVSVIAYVLARMPATFAAAAAVFEAVKDAVPEFGPREAEGVRGRSLAESYAKRFRVRRCAEGGMCG